MKSPSKTEKGTAANAAKQTQKRPVRPSRNFGYMRLDGANPDLATFRQMLHAADIVELFDDTPAVMDMRPRFDAMLKKARPGDTIVLVRLGHFSTSWHLVDQCVKLILSQGLNIRIVERASAELTPAAALLSDYIRTVTDKILKEGLFHEGGDGGGGNGGP
jgi:hypothetical protein